MIWSYYDLETGIFTGGAFSGSKAAFDKNRRGRAAVQGRYDRRRQRVDLATGNVVEYEAPAGDDRDRILARIGRLEARQARPLRELAIDPANDDALARLVRIEFEIAELRASLKE